MLLLNQTAVLLLLSYSYFWVLFKSNRTCICNTIRKNDESREAKNGSYSNQSLTIIFLCYRLLGMNALNPEKAVVMMQLDICGCQWHSLNCLDPEWQKSSCGGMSATSCSIFDWSCSCSLSWVAMSSSTDKSYM